MRTGSRRRRRSWALRVRTRSPWRVGAGLWALLAETRRVDELVAALSEGNDVTREKDLATLLQELASTGTVEWLRA